MKTAVLRKGRAKLSLFLAAAHAHEPRYKQSIVNNLSELVIIENRLITDAE